MRAASISLMAFALASAVTIGPVAHAQATAPAAARKPAPQPALDPALTPPAVAPAKPVNVEAKDEATVSSDVTPAAVSTPVRKLRSLPLKDFPHSRGGTPLVWDSEYRRVSTGDFVLTAADAGVALAALIVKPLNNGWTGPILFDNGARNTLRLTSLDARGLAADTSDVLLSVSLMGPFLVDSLATAWWYRGSKDVAQQMAMIDGETLSITAAIQGLSAMFAGRQRPYVQTCGKVLPNSTVECQTDSKDRSFFSGHTSLTFTSAALVCSHHLNLDLFEDNPADEFSCASAEFAAASTGLLRIMSDNHWASDVLTGAIVGNAVGFGAPYFLHYRRHKKGDAAPTSAERRDFSVHFLPTGLGAAAVGTW
jgi:membrane-associated phospholipid phosphatase